MDLISWDDFTKVELSVERVVNAEIFEKPVSRLTFFRSECLVT